MQRLSDRSAIVILSVWMLLLTGVGCTARHYILPVHPCWDNLGYQNQALRVSRLVLDGRLQDAGRALIADRSAGHTLAIGAALMLDGLRPDAPYFASAFAAWLFVVACFLLARELGARAEIATGALMVLATLPQFLYQSHLQTRNDYPLAAFLTLATLFMLRGMTRGELVPAVIAGALAGIGTLFKSSGPGYVMWAAALLIALPIGLPARPFAWKLRFVCALVVGAVAVCGGPYLANLRETLLYYGYWAGKKGWIQRQYGLTGPLDFVLFYARNLVVTHLTGGGLALLAAGLGTGVVTRGLPVRAALAWLVRSGALFVGLAYAVPVAFLTYRGSLASLGDVPVLGLALAVLVALISKAVPERLSRRFALALACAAPLALAVNLGHLPVAERIASASDFPAFASTLLEVQRQFDLQGVARWQVYSHPLYNVDGARWSWYLDPRIPTDDTLESEDWSSPHRCTGYLAGGHLFLKRIKLRELIPFEDPEEAPSIAAEFAKLPLVITMDGDSLGIGGEPFHTWNRMQAELTRCVEATGQFVEVRRLAIEGGKRTLHFLLNRDHAAFVLEEPSADGWIMWKSAVELVAPLPVRLRVRAYPVADLDRLTLRGDGGEVVLERTGTEPDGRTVFESRTAISSSLSKHRYTLEGPPAAMKSASAADPRLLALRDPAVEVLPARWTLEPPTADGWSLWGQHVSLIIEKPERLRLSGQPAHPVDAFELADAGGRTHLRFARKAAPDQASVQYETTDPVPAGTYADLRLTAAPAAMGAASAADPRPLAFRGVELSVAP